MDPGPRELLDNPVWVHQNDANVIVRAKFEKMIEKCAQNSGLKMSCVSCAVLEVSRPYGGLFEMGILVRLQEDGSKANEANKQAVQ